MGSDDPPHATTSLLSSSIKKPNFITTSYGLLFTILVALLVALVFAFLFFHSSTPETPKKLKRPVVILVSSDGFRFGYQFKTDTPNINRLIRNGTEAEHGLIPCFPTLTFPNHYSIVTGLYPVNHGIIMNSFTDFETGETFTPRSIEQKWWLGEPLWETVVNQGLKASVYYWPGADVQRGKWTCPEFYCPKYNWSIPFNFEERVDTVLSYFDLETDDIPSFMALYLEEPDNEGHLVGPDHPRITEAVARVDSLMGRLIDGLETRGIFDDVHIILVGDHGMVGNCDEKLITLDDLAPWIEVKKDWIQSYSPLLAIRPTSDYSPKDVVAKMNEALSSGKVENGEYLKVYLKEDLPSRLHYSDSDRISPIIGMVGEGFKVQQQKSTEEECGGSHGYDNAYFSMRSIFIAHGPQIGKGKKVPSFENVHIYNLVTRILGISGAPNNGSMMLPDNILLSSH